MINGVGFTGKMKSGKDTCATYLTEEILKWKGPNYIINRFAFADSLKDICMNYLGLSRHDCYDQEGKEAFNEFWGMTNREILQRVGTEAMRNGFHPDVWAKITELKIKEAVDNGEFFIITDVRFPNEAETIIRNGGIIIEVLRPNTESNGIRNHASEQRLPMDLISRQVVNNKDLDNLKNEMIMIKSVIRQIERKTSISNTTIIAG
ncbi:MAG: hypothetical protein IKA36_05155 [Clostridia bacterium]|nr:hypothetical protein [Clostridia bacterium]